MNPDAIVLPSGVDVRRVQQGLDSLPVGSVALGRSAVIARSPLVLAVPERWAGELGLPPAGDEIALAKLLDRARAAGPGASSFRLFRAATALFDTIVEAVDTVRRPDAAETMNAVVVFTDGQDDDPHTVGVDGVVTTLTDEAEPPVKVFVLAFGDAPCQQDDLVHLTARAGVTCFDPASDGGLDAAFDGIAAGLWGVER